MSDAAAVDALLNLGALVVGLVVFLAAMGRG